jgi:predicted dehydrogenase
MQATRIGVIGMGKMGTYHLRKYHEIEACTVVGIVDVDQACVDNAAEGYDCAAHTDHRELIGKVDAVSIAVPTSDHCRTAKDFLANGIDVLLEKPIAATLAEADEMLRLSKEHGTILQIGFIERFNPAITALADFLEKPLFIESHRLHPFFSRGTDVDVVLDLMIHDLDIILHFMDSAVSQVDATGISVLSDEIDIANARITFKNGCVANVTASRVTNKVMQKMRFFSRQGYNSVDFAKRELTSLHRRFDEQGKPVISQNPVSIKRCDPLEAEIRSFVQAVRTRQQPVVTAEDGRASLEISLEIINRMHENLENLRP